jgi:hypothetical protein
VIAMPTVDPVQQKAQQDYFARKTLDETKEAGYNKKVWYFLAPILIVIVALGLLLSGVLNFLFV